MEYKEEIDIVRYQKLREEVGWLNLPIEEAKAGLDHSSYKIGCYDQGRMIGMARIIWDGGYIAYLSDVIVDSAYQKKGIGKELVLHTMDYVRKQIQPGWKIKMVLAAAKGKEGFYEKLGFLIRPNENGGPGMDMWMG